MISIYALVVALSVGLAFRGRLGAQRCRRADSVAGPADRFASRRRGGRRDKPSGRRAVSGRARRAPVVPSVTRSAGRDEVAGAATAERGEADLDRLELGSRPGECQVADEEARRVDPGAAAGSDVAAAVPVPVLAAVWCCSVGATWTVELHERGRSTALGRIVDWVSSGVPISEPAPSAATARELLTKRGFQLSPDSSAGPTCPHRHGIGYVRRDDDLIKEGIPDARSGPDPGSRRSTPARRAPDPSCVAPGRPPSLDERRLESSGADTV